MFRQWIPERVRQFRLPALRRSDRAENHAPGFAPLLKALVDRGDEGQKTQLRDLHAITGLTQPEAFQMLQAMEQRGLVEVGNTSHDRLSSTVQLTDHARELVSVCKAA